MLSSREREFHSKFKKNYSVLQNALRRAQVQEGLLGDNTAIFTPSSDANRHYNSAVRFSKYTNAVKVCKNQSSSGCESLYYDVKYSLNGYLEGQNAIIGSARVLLADGSLWAISQNTACDWYAQVCVRNSDGTCKTNDDGSTMLADPNHRLDCAELSVDVNGAAGPNKYGKDVFNFYVRQDKIVNINYAPRGGSKALDIIKGKV